MAVRRSAASLAIAIGAAVALTAGMVAPVSADPDNPPVTQTPHLPLVELPTPAEPTDTAPPQTPVEALDQVRDLFDVNDAGRGNNAVGPEGLEATNVDATLALHALSQVRDELPPELQPVAARFFARPTDGNLDQFGDGYSVAEANPECSDVVCVHYVTSTQDGVPATDVGANGKPDFVEQALTYATQVDSIYRAAGYRPPLGDGTKGGSALPDIYLADIGPGIYGYCTTDRDAPEGDRVWSYCVLDNDYASNQFPNRTAFQNLAVTLAHEYFHAVQFGYDFNEDAWFMEATATWAEDQVFDAINDNVQYLRDSPISNPLTSLDTFEGLFPYGSWIFFRYLSERHPVAEGGMPTIVRDIWRQADSAPGAPHLYSLQAINRILTARGTSLTKEFALFSQANRFPQLNYSEATALRYPASPAVRSLKLSKRKAKSGRISGRLDHLTSATIRLAPGAGLNQRKWRLRLKLNLAPQHTRPAAVVTVVPKSGRPSVRYVPLNGQGDKIFSVNFSKARVRQVQVTLVNASDRFACKSGTSYSCNGRALNDSVAAAFTAQVFLRR